MSLVSILIPTYNQPEFFRRALKSALAQDYPDIEIIVSDDSTDDRVKNVVDEFLSKPQRFPIRYIDHSQKNLNGDNNHISILNSARGEFVNFLFHDDLFMPNKISTMMKYFEQDSENRIAFVTSNRYIIDENDTVTDIWGIDDEPSGVKIFSGDELGRENFLLSSNFIGEPTTVLFRRNDLFYDTANNCYRNDRFFDQPCTCLEDLGTWLDLARKKDSIVPFITEPLSAFRKHPDQNSENYQVIFESFTDWAHLLASSYLHDVFIHDEETFHQSCQQYLNRISAFINARSNKFTYDPKIFLYMDNLIQIIESLSNEEYDRFLKFAMYGREKV